LNSILIYGYGNPGRQDDGLGPYIADQINSWAKANNHEHIHTDSNYQLNIEDADNIAPYDIVIFVDATIEDIDKFAFKEIFPSEEVNFTMHTCSATYILHLCESMYNKRPKTFMLSIKGYEWNMMKEGLSLAAKSNAADALSFIIKWIINQ
ncbi:hydrogenase maturation protease, partial [bacterium]|nr:hydrogenase maturation protease [bacterium]MBU1917479.1 hydrogenase maturation protease [bacterium]